MVFSDLFFLFVFIPLFALSYLLANVIDKRLLPGTVPPVKSADGTVTDIPRRLNRSKNWVIIIFSIIFYAWGEPVYVFLMLFCVFINYLVGRWIGSTKDSRKLPLVIGLICNIAILCTFKYLGFFAQFLCDLGLPVPVPNIALPIGISFYTFQSISYLIDVYRRESPVQRRFTDLLLYISMFPQLIAGPIVRYGTVAKELHERHVNSKDFAEGSYRFLIGLGKKVILANQLSEVSDQFLANGLSSITTTGAWIGIVAFTLQIYYDFSGYSDMAIGMGRCMGFHFNENFNHPYICNSITDFWRRWHMSLGSFFRDYVYIPLGGNRRHQMVNILLVWFLTGMWHGASWNFIIWGLYFGVIVTAEKYILLRLPEKRWMQPLLHLYSMLIVIVGWGIFYFDELGSMQQFFAAFIPGSSVFHDFVTTSALLDHAWLWLIAILFAMPLRHAVSEFFTHRLGADHRWGGYCMTAWRIVCSLAILVISVSLLVGATNNAFIYTRF